MRRLACLTPFALLSACHTPVAVPPPPPPSWSTHATRFGDAALAGATAFPPPATQPGSPAAVQLTVLALAALPDGEALAAHAAVIARRDQPEPLGGHPRTLQQVRLIRDPAVLATTAAAARARWDHRLELPAATTAAVSVQEATTAVGPTLLLRPEANGCHLALAAADGEQVLLDLTWRPPDALLFAVPQDRADCAGIGLLLQAVAAPDLPALAVAPQRDVAAMAADSRQRLAAPDTRALTLRAQATAFTTLVGERQRRPALLGLCLRVGAARCADLALVAHERTLMTLAERVRQLGIEPARSDAALAFDLDRLALLVLTPDLQRDTLTPGLAAFLVRHAGAAGRNAGELAAAVAAATDLPSLRAALLAANEQALHDSDPAVRVRACDWLARRGMVVADYDPLGERTARRAALQAFERQRQAAAGVGR